MNKKTAVFILLAVVAAIYGNSLFGKFVWDDSLLIAGRSGFFSDPGNILTLFASSDTPPDQHALPYYRPLTVLTYLLDYQLWGLNPFWYHLENVLVHAVVVVLLYLLIAEYFGDPALALFSALLFAVHPVNAEPVNFISARNNMLCAAFMLATLLLLGKKGRAWPALSVLAFVLALLGKEPAVTLPFFLLSLTLLTGDGRYRAGKRALAAYFAAVAAYFLMRLAVLGTLSSPSGVEISARRFELVLSVLYENFRLMLFPLRLNALYGRESVAYAPYKILFAAAGPALFFYLSVRKRTPEPVRAGSLWVLWGLLPISNIVLFPSAPVAERYLYIPLLGFSLMAGYAIKSLSTRKAAAGAALLAALALVLGAKTFERNFVWRDDAALFQSMLRSDPRNAEAHFNLGFEYLRAGRTDLTYREWMETVRLDPGHDRALNNLGNLCSLKGDYVSAGAFYEKALNANPKEIVVHFNIARAAEKAGDKEKAVRHYRLLIEKAAASPLPGYQDKVDEARARLHALTVRTK